MKIRIGDLIVNVEAATVKMKIRKAYKTENWIHAVKMLRSFRPDYSLHTAKTTVDKWCADLKEADRA